ncbi:MAG: uracil-DNA glycosylase [Flavobacteriales bacterium]|nr:uracil-DNA glycosylase [Flavobacteriales bacterium]
MSSVSLEKSWLEVLQPEFEKDYFKKLKEFLVSQKQLGKIIFPPGNKIFAALDACPFHRVKVVIIGQDPYHGVGQAHGLCFSVNRGVEQPPSLINIFKEIKSDLDIAPPTHGDLSCWAEQGVLLLNATLTVEAHKAGSHQNKGWEIFTDKIIELLNEKRKDLVFMLWGGYAKQKGKHIDSQKHLVLLSGHPSPLSANKGHWFGNKHFSSCNSFLRGKGFGEIDWSV